MEYLDGPTLEELVRQAGPLPSGRVVYLLRQLCGALAEAHAAVEACRESRNRPWTVCALQDRFSKSHHESHE
jgi:serine/threonine protein kinase